MTVLIDKTEKNQLNYGLSIINRAA